MLLLHKVVFHGHRNWGVCLQPIQGIETFFGRNLRANRIISHFGAGKIRVIGGAHVIEVGNEVLVLGDGAASVVGPCVCCEGLWAVVGLLIV